MRFEFVSESKEQTKEFGSFLSSFAFPGEVILLEGDLGAGKTTFAGGFAKGLGIEGEVISPTFNIMKCYFNGRLSMFHIDAYRLENQNIELGLEEFIEGDGVSLIEWPVFIESLIPDDPLHITIHNLGGDRRQFIVEGEGKRYEPLFQALEGKKE